ncbi:hypothetical protein [Pseudomonas sp. nanlin1]|uniref:hypothetical protein n=1 Tax=Pseudomonas sp. nanlin1 TaxID=3040605 RepID=UPI00388EE858
MNVWRRLAIVLSVLLLSGCLVTFPKALPPEQAAPANLLGKWASKDAWGEHLNLTISRVGPNRYHATSRALESAEVDRKKPKVSLDQVDFTVARHGSRWYASATMPKEYGGRYALAGFELTEGGELVVYNLDVEQVKQALEQKALRGEVYEAQQNEGVLVESPLEEVFAYLDDPANSDVFIEIARYQRAK